jgi:cytoskeletal protein CcmA (bactofilin family)
MPSPMSSQSESPLLHPQRLKSELPYGAIRPQTTVPERGTNIGKSILIKGQVSGSEPIYIEGQIEGPSLQGAYVNIGRDGTVVSDVEAGEVVVRGKLHGKVTASDRVEIHAGASVVGDVATGRISVEDGAHLQGHIEVQQLAGKPSL